MNIKKYLPLILLVLGLVVVVVGFLTLRNRGEEVEEETAQLLDVALEDRPIASLTPSDDGYWLKLVIDKIKVEAASLDYELLYKVADGRTQGVPGSVKLDGSPIERDLLLGSESSGKFRYDEGVETGTLTLRFRNDKGKLIAKFSTEFSLLTGTKNLAFSDTAFAYELDSTSKDFFVVMETFGHPGEAPGEVTDGPYAVFSSATTKQPGAVDLGSGTIHRWDGTSWKALSGSTSPDVGIFLDTSS